MLALAPVALTGSPQTVSLIGQAPQDRQTAPIRLANESPYALQVTLGGDVHWLQPWTVDVFTPPQPVNSIGINPTILTSPLPPAPSSTLIVTLADLGETIPGSYPAPLMRQAAAYGQPQELLPVLAVAAGASTTEVYQLPAGTQSIAFVTVQSAGGSPSGNAALTGQDGNGSTFFGQNPVSRNQWSYCVVTQSPSNELSVTLDMTGVTGSGVIFTATLVALPYVAAVGVTTFSGLSVALRPTSFVTVIGATQSFYGSATHPSGGQAIVATGSLAGGPWRVSVDAWFGSTADTANPDNMKLVIAGQALVGQLRVPPIAETADQPRVSRLFDVVSLNGSQVLHVEAINQAAVNTVYKATIDVTPLAA